MTKSYILAIALVVLIVFFSKETMAQWTNNQNAEYVLGQANFSSYSYGSGTNQLEYPSGVAIDYTNNKLYVADYSNNRVLRFSYPISGNQPTPDRIFGTGINEVTQTGTPSPRSVAVYNGTLYVLSLQANRITRYNNASTGSGDAPAANGLYGQTTYTAASLGTTSSKFYYPEDIFIDASGNLWVADAYNNRVLKFTDINSKATDGSATADLVLGQTNFTSDSYGTTQSKFFSPSGVELSGTTVWVTDKNNHRVLRFDNPTSDGASASGVLGQSNYTSSSSGLTSSTFYYPFDLTVDGSGRLYVSDQYNARIMIFNEAASKSNGASADNLLGQSNFTTRTTTNGGQNGFYNEYDEWMEEEFHYVFQVNVDDTNNKLLVCDAMNNRILQFAASSALPVELISFTANVLNNKISLNWQTATEVDNYGFDVQRSVLSGKLSEWETIGFLHGHGNSNSPKDYSFVDDKVSSVGKYFYRLKQIDTDGSYEYSKIVEVDFGQPNKFELLQNYPNPFNPRTVISYQLSASGNVTLKIYDVLGNEVAVLVDNEWQEIGKYTYQFAAGESIDNSPKANQLQSGIYFYQLRAGNYLQVKKMVIAK